MDPKDQRKTTFTCSFGVFACRRMPFELCNAPVTFQRCMIAIFLNLVGKYIEVFMEACLMCSCQTLKLWKKGLSRKISFLIGRNVILWWLKGLFLVTISSRGIEVDKSKVDVIKNLPPPVNVKGIRSFLGHAGFYRRFIKDFSKIAKPLSNLPNMDTPFNFDVDFLNVFNHLKSSLVSAPIIIAPDWSLHFKVVWCKWLCSRSCTRPKKE